MPVHLPDENYVTYSAQADITQIASQEFLCRTMLTEWFSTNQRYEEARDLSYCDFLSRWCWNDSTRACERRQRDGRKIGRVYFVHPSSGERYYLRMLLVMVKGAQSYECLLTYNGITHSTFKEACNEQGLLSDDKEWYNAFDEVAHWATSNQLRHLFIIMLLFCEVGDEYKFFEFFWKLLADDVQYNVPQNLNHQEYQMPDCDL
jgi:hypothetical protein